MGSQASRATSFCDVAMIGLGVMGRNLALNLADHGFRVAVHDRDGDLTRGFVSDYAEVVFPEEGGLHPGESLTDLLACLARPRVFIVLVPAGDPVDAVCQSLIDAGIERDDLVVDGGNSLWTDTIRRSKQYRDRFRFFGSGISGGASGARFGPSLMPGGDRESWQHLKPMWEAIAAKVDPETGKPIDGAAPGKPITHGEPCTAYIGPDGAGHYVKMVHNGIEYADMQLICEAYHLMRSTLGMDPRAIGDVFEQWTTSELDSYLIEITSDILRQDDPQTGKPFVDIVLDRAGQKGTGRWTAQNALDMGMPTMSVAEAVFMRSMSALKDERSVSAKAMRGPAANDAGVDDRAAFCDALHDALYCAKVCVYAQGFQLMRAAAQASDWSFDFGAIARIWRGGCIIRAQLLQRITAAFDRDASLANLLIDPEFAAKINEAQSGWREVVCAGVRSGIPCPAMASALAYYDAYRTEVLPANLLQAQRDYFGAHSYERVDQAPGRRFHLDWPTDPRVEIAIEP